MMSPVHRTLTAPPDEFRRRRTAAGSLVVAAVAQLVGQAMLRLPASSGTWDAAHVALVLAAVALLVAAAAIALLVGPGPGTWVGVAALVVGQSLTLAVLAIDLTGASVEVDVIRTLDTWDFLAVAGLVVLLLELRRRRGDVVLGANLALVALAVPPVDGLVVIAAVGVVVGFAALAHHLVTGRGHLAHGWLAVVSVVAYAVAGTVSWQRAALAVVVLAWTVHHLRARTDRVPVEAV